MKLQHSLIVLLIAILGVVCSVNVRTTIDEESPIHASVVNLWQSLHGKKSTDKSSFRIIPENPYFSVDEYGEIKIASRIDRENRQMCKDASETKPCKVDFTVFNPELTSVSVSIEVKDTNDNAPVFLQKYKVITIDENSKKVSYMLELATDADIGDNGLLTKGRYYLKEDEDIFTLDDSSKGFLYLALKGEPIIDYERQKQYNLTLRACDGGLLQKCADQMITVQIRDMNDNSPNITKIDVKDVLENVTIGSRIGRIYVHDADSGLNGQIVFKITDTRLADIFLVDDLGFLKTRQTLNAKVHESFDIPIVVSDKGEPPNTVPTRVSFRVIDVNNHLPVVEQIPFAQGSKRIEISENLAGQKIALLSVSDGDLGSNANVTCDLRSPSDASTFSISKNSDSLYMLSLIRPFDYEVMESEAVMISCKDQGSPQLETVERVVVNFINVNEYAPEFIRPESYYISVDEETPIGVEKFKVFAEDKDRNEILNFTANSQYFTLFSIDSSSQIQKTVATASLRVKSRIDRENLGDHIVDDTLKFEIIVVDSADQTKLRRTATATMTVSIKDINDNSPEIRPPFTFQVLENQKPGIQARSVPEGATVIKSFDPDKGANGAVFFQLIDLKAEETLSKRALRFNERDWPFLLTENGEIETLKKLDREQYDRYVLTVKAYNKAVGPRNAKNTTKDIYVTILDENDNQPFWNLPSTGHMDINITTSQTINDEVTRVEARDLDIGSNITYTLIESSGYFELNKNTGQVMLIKELTPGVHRLVIRADDNGAPNRFNHTKININVINSKPGFGFGPFRDSQVNLTIIVAMIIITALVSVGLVFAIICVRRRAQGFIPPSECDKDGCQCQCSLPDMDMHSMMGGMEPLYGQLSKPTPRMDRLFPMTTFNNNGPSGYDVRPMDMQRNEIVVNQQDLDGDSADSGRGGSEDDHGGHHMSNGSNAPSNHRQYGSSTLPRHMMTSPPVVKTSCQCLGIPEEDGTCGDCHHNQPPSSVNSQLSSFLPPPIPPHGVEYSNGRSNATLPRLFSARQTSTPNGASNFYHPTITRSPIPEHSMGQPGQNPYLRQLSTVLDKSENSNA